MKKLAIIMGLLVVLSTQAKSQTFLELYSEYKEYCEELIDREVTQTGTVQYELIPVKNSVGKTVQYERLVVSDTIWNDIDCPEYKHEREFFSMGNFYWDNDTLQFNTYYNSELEEEVTRKHICKVKRENPTPDGFFRWVDVKLVKN